MKKSLTLPELDRVDRRLLTLVQDDASQSNVALAEAARVSPATATRRLQRLLAGGAIERRSATLAAGLLPASLTVIAEVTLDRQAAELLDAFEQRAVAEAAVQQCYRVSPGPDFVLVLWLADMPAYHALVQRLFTQDANVRNVKSYFSVRRAKFEPRIELPEVAT